MNNRPSIEKYAYKQFRQAFNAGRFAGQRYGQAFYNHFGLEKMADQAALRNIYNHDGDQARALIAEVFHIE